MKKICAISGKEFLITDEDLKFYEKMGVPVPTLCPEERLKRRLSWRNDRSFFKRNCSATNEAIISLYHLDQVFPVFNNKYWWSDQWDALTYAQEFCFDKQFFKQFNELLKRVPQLAIINDNNIQSENCAYCQDLSKSRNCYFTMESWFAEDVLYSHHCDHVKDISDCLSIFNGAELAYECIFCTKIFHCGFLQNCEGCHNCFFGYDLKGCRDCYCCSGLRHKQYCIFNKQYTKEEYEKHIKNVHLRDFIQLETLKNKFKNWLLSKPRKATILQNCENCEGHQLLNSKNVLGFGSFNSQDSKYIINSDSAVSSYDCQGGNYQWNLECITCDDSWMTMYSLWCWKSKNMFYSNNCHNCEDCFGCVSLKRKQYCILNKQYSKEEYFQLRDKIIEHMKKTGEWGEFFPIELSPFAYNETVAQEYFPMTKEEVLAKGWKWRDDSTDKSRLVPTLDVIPDDIADVPDSICNEILACETCGKNYKIQKAELKFYRKMNLPIPHKCPDCRHAERMKLRNPRKLFERKCDQCGTDIQTTFAPERPEKVYCEKCYLDAVE